MEFVVIVVHLEFFSKDRENDPNHVEDPPGWSKACAGSIPMTWPTKVEQVLDAAARLPPPNVSVNLLNNRTLPDLQSSLPRKHKGRMIAQELEVSLHMAFV